MDLKRLMVEADPRNYDCMTCMMLLVYVYEGLRRGYAWIMAFRHVVHKYVLNVL